MKPMTMTQTTFDSAINSFSAPVFADFWAEWCGPRKMLAPLLDEIATEKAGSAVIEKENMDDLPRIRRALRHHRCDHAHRLQNRPTCPDAAGSLIAKGNLNDAGHRSSMVSLA